MEQQILLSEIATDTLNGLSSDPKFLLSKYFYDDTGSAIFQDIMNMPEYYLTNCEHEIFSEQKDALLNVCVNGNNRFNLVELGSGDGLKTKILLKHFTENKVDFQYIPIDISQKANDDLVESLAREIPGLSVSAKTGDYFHQLEKLNSEVKKRKIIFFLGSNIGNFTDEETKLFLARISEFTNKGDKVLMGFDLKKSPEIVINAYNDPHGHTAGFIFNHLVRLNNELGADFDLGKFEHHVDYNEKTGELKSFLISNADQEVLIEMLGQKFCFKKEEPIFMELSRKYDFESIESLASENGFRIEKNFTDRRNYFVDSLWKRI
ncbi:MAG: L-histidine N(alpha)-methyltransferase [Tangfeifania sp.]